jgi:hypothetical protein
VYVPAGDSVIINIGGASINVPASSKSTVKAQLMLDIV